VAWSPDGKMLASGNWDKTIGLWEAATGKEVRRLTWHESDVWSVAYSPDGKTLGAADWDST